MPVLTPEQREQYLKSGKYESKINKENFFEFRKMTSKDYGHIFWLGVIIVGIGNSISHGSLLDLLISLLGTLGLISGIAWIVDKTKQRNKKD